MAEDVNELHTAMGDPSEWGEPIEVPAARKSEKRRRSAVISVRLTPSELETVEGLAAAAGVPLGTFMRQQALEGEKGSAVNADAEVAAWPHVVAAAAAVTTGQFYGQNQGGHVVIANLATL